MIPIQRVPVSVQVQKLLDSRTQKMKDAGGTYEEAKKQWKAAQAAKNHLQGLLGQMAHGVKRCMYCEDNLGTDIDHFQPMKQEPLRSFDWPNHLLACSHCNSNWKRDRYPCDVNGQCLLVDPTVDDPFDHLTLLLRTGAFSAKTHKGRHTIEVFGLNRPDLVTGRQVAFSLASSTMINWHHHVNLGDAQEADILANRLKLSPFATVVRAIEVLDPSLDGPVLKPAATPAVRAWRALRGSAQD